MLYVIAACPYRRKQFDELEQLGLPFQLHYVSRDRSAQQEAKEKYKARIVPVLVENGKVKSFGYQGMG